MYLLQFLMTMYDLGNTQPPSLCLNWHCLASPLWVNMVLACYLRDICILSLNLNS